MDGETVFKPFSQKAIALAYYVPKSNRTEYVRFSGITLSDLALELKTWQGMQDQWKQDGIKSVLTSVHRGVPVEFHHIFLYCYVDVHVHVSIFGGCVLFSMTQLNS